MKKVFALVLALLLMAPAFACSESNPVAFGTNAALLEPFPEAPETDSFAEMTAAMEDGAAVVALVAEGSEERYVFITHGINEIIFIFDPKNPGLNGIESWQLEEMGLVKFYLFYNDVDYGLFTGVR